MYWVHTSFGSWSSTFYFEDYNSEGMNTNLLFLLCALFIEGKVVYVRVCNKPAHTLAAMGMTGVQNGHQEWVEHFPVDVSRVLYGNSAVQVITGFSSFCSSIEQFCTPP
jgi:hypothetical protein